jgi:hypothetical protein
MQSDEIAPAVRELINRHIRSMDHVEAVLQLADAPGETHAAESVASRHRWAHNVAHQVLRDLTDSGIATPVDGGYRLATEAVDAAALTSLNKLYHRHPVSLVRAIYAAPTPIKPLIRPPRKDDDPSPDEA